MAPSLEAYLERIGFLVRIDISLNFCTKEKMDDETMDNMRKHIKELQNLKRKVEKQIKDIQNEPPEIREARQKILESYKHHISPVSEIIRLQKALGKNGPQVSDEATSHIAKGILKQINALVEAQIQSDSEMDEKQGFMSSVSADDPDTYKTYQITAICYAMIETLSQIGVVINPAYTENLNQDLIDYAFDYDDELEDEDEDIEEEGMLSSYNPLEDEEEALEEDSKFQNFVKNYEAFENKFFPFGMKHIPNALNHLKTKT